MRLLELRLNHETASGIDVSPLAVLLGRRQAFRETVGLNVLHANDDFSCLIDQHCIDAMIGDELNRTDAFGESPVKNVILRIDHDFPRLIDEDMLLRSRRESDLAVKRNSHECQAV